MRIYGVGLLVLSLAATEVRAEGSLFYTQEELQRIDAATRAAPSQMVQTADMIHLGAVMYYGPGEWSLWLQNAQWTPATKRPDIRVVAVTADQVRLALTPTDDGAAKEIILRPYQTYNRVTGRISEGGN